MLEQRSNTVVIYAHNFITLQKGKTASVTVQMDRVIGVILDGTITISLQGHCPLIISLLSVQNHNSNALIHSFVSCITLTLPCVATMGCIRH